MNAASSKSLFRATKAKPHRDERQAAFDVGGEQRKPERERRALDLYPTGQPDAIRALFAKDGARICGLGTVWEPAAGRGDLVRELEAEGLTCFASDIADHGCPDVLVRSFYDFRNSPADAIITNPPYCEINARDGHGKWLRHTLSMPSWRYCALLLSWDWPAARANGLGELLDANPFTRCYLMRWKLDFTGEGSPPQRNAWFVWDRDDPRDTTGNYPSFHWMDRADGRQGSLFR
jgi:hypothetical protein